MDGPSLASLALTTWLVLHAGCRLLKVEFTGASPPQCGTGKMDRNGPSLALAPLCTAHRYPLLPLVPTCTILLLVSLHHLYNYLLVYLRAKLHLFAEPC
jgi:hypothetical protein